MQRKPQSTSSTPKGSGHNSKASTPSSNHAKVSSPSLLSASNLFTGSPDFIKDYYRKPTPNDNLNIQKSSPQSQPRLKILKNLENLNIMMRQESAEVSPVNTQNYRQNPSTPTIEMKHLFNNKEKKTNTKVLITGANSLLPEYIVQEQEGKKLWDKEFNYVIKADLGDLVDEITEQQTLPEKFDVEALFNNFLITAFHGIKILSQDIKSILKSKKTLLILYGFEKLNHLRSPNQHIYIYNILTLATQYNCIIISKDNENHPAIKSINFDINLENIDLFPKDIQTYLKSEFGESSLYHHILLFIKNNPSIEAITSNQMILKIICDHLKSLGYVPTISEIYNKVIHQMGLFHLDSYYNGNTKDVFLLPIVKLMKELAFKSLANDKNIQNELLNELLLKYNDVSIENLKSFGVIELKRSLSTETEYGFIYPSIHYFMASMHLTDLLFSKKHDDLESAKSFIASHSDNKEYFLLMKFTSGLINRRQDSETKIIAIESLFSAIIGSNKSIIKIAGDNKIILIINLLSQINQHIISTSQLLSRLVSCLDSIIIKDLKKWSKHLIISKYSSKAILDKLESNLLLDNKEETIISSKILPLLIDNNEHKDKISPHIITLTQHEDLEIAEHAVQSLKHLSSTNTQQALLSAIDGNRISIRLAAIEISAQIANEDVIYKLIENLNNEDSLVVLATIKSLKHLEGYQLLREEIRNALLLKLTNISSKNQILLKETLTTLKKFGLDINKIIESFKNQISDSDEQTVIKAYNTLKNLMPLIPDGERDIITTKMISCYNYGSTAMMLFPANKHKPSTKVAIIEAITEIYSYSTHKEEIYSFLIQHSSSDDNSIKNESIKGLEKIFHHNPTEIYAFLIEKLKKATTSDLDKIIIIETIATCFLHISAENKEAFILLLLLLSSQDTSNDKAITIPIMKALGTIFPLIYKELQQKVFDKILFNAVTPSESRSQITAIIVLTNTFSSLNQDQKFTTQQLISESSSSHIKSVKDTATKANKIILYLINKEAGYKPNLTNLSAQELLNNSQIKKNIDIINDLADKYTEKNLKTELEDQITINQLFGVILFLSIKSNNNIMHIRLGSLLTRAEYNEDNLLEILSQQNNLNSRVQEVKIVKNIFKEQLSENLLEKLDSLSTQALNIIDDYPKLDSILDDLDNFAKYINLNHLDVSITREFLSINEQKYNLGGNIDYARTIYEALKKSSLYEPLNTIPQNDEKSIFDEINDTNLGNKIQLSILHKTTNEGRLKKIILILEEKTIFGDVLAHKIILGNSEHYLTTVSSIKENYIEEIFGNHADAKYYITSGFIEQDKKNQLLSSLKTYQSQEKFITTLSSTFEFIKEALENDHWRNSHSIRYSELIKYNPLEKRMNLLEHRMDDTETLVNEEISRINLTEERIEEIKKLFQAEVFQVEIGKEKVLTNFSPYQKSLYHTIVRELLQLHTAATVVQTEMVTNSEKGLIGSTGSLLNIISPHIPMAGAAIDFFGYLLGIVDQELQSRYSEKIRLLADDPVSMTELAREFAFKVATTNFDINKIENEQSILDHIKSTIDFTEDIKRSIAEKLVNIAFSTYDSPISGEKARGQNDAKTIITRLITLIIARDYDLFDDIDNKSDILIQLFIDNYAILSDASEPIRSTKIPNLPISMPSHMNRGLSITILSSLTSTPRDRSLSDNLIGISRQKSFDEMESQQGDISPSTNSFLSANALSRSLDSIESSRSTVLKFNEILDSDSHSTDSSTAIPYQSYLSSPYLIENVPKSTFDIGAYGGVLMNGVEIIPSVKYLVNQCTPIGYLTRNWNIEETIAPYEHYVYTGLHVLGNAFHTYHHDINSITPILSSFTFAAKPQLYAFRDNVLSSIKAENNNWWIKAITYVSADTLMSLAIASPFIAISPPLVIGFFTAKGIIDGSISYYKSTEQPKDTIFGEITSVGATSLALYPCYNLITSQYNFIDQIIATEACIPILAAVHYYAKLIGNSVSDSAQSIFTGDIKVDMEN